MVLVLLPVNEFLVSRIANLVKVDCLGGPILLVRLVFIFAGTIVAPSASAVAVNIARAVIGCLIAWVLALPQPPPLTRYLSIVSI